VPPALAERTASYYRRKSGAPEPEPASRTEYLQWAKARTMAIQVATDLLSAAPPPLL
jgi:hypothetical protein